MRGLNLAPSIVSRAIARNALESSTPAQQQTTLTAGPEFGDYLRKWPGYLRVQPLAAVHPAAGNEGWINPSNRTRTPWSGEVAVLEASAFRVRASEGGSSRSRQSRHHLRYMVETASTPPGSPGLRHGALRGPGATSGSSMQTDRSPICRPLVYGDHGACQDMGEATAAGRSRRLWMRCAWLARRAARATARPPSGFTRTPNAIAGLTCAAGDGGRLPGNHPDNDRAGQRRETGPSLPCRRALSTGRAPPRRVALIRDQVQHVTTANRLVHNTGVQPPAPPPLPMVLVAGPHHGAGHRHRRPGATASSIAELAAADDDNQITSHSVGREAGHGRARHNRGAACSDDARFGASRPVGVLVELSSAGGPSASRRVSLAASSSQYRS